MTASASTHTILSWNNFSYICLLILVFIKLYSVCKKIYHHRYGSPKFGDMWPMGLPIPVEEFERLKKIYNKENKDIKKES